MLARFTEMKDLIYKEIEKFRQNGAVTPEDAMSIQDLGLSSQFKTFLRNSPRLLGVFVNVDNKYYLSEERLKKIEEQLSVRPLRQWLRHTASVPKGLLRFYTIKLLKEKPMSGSEIMEEVEKQTGGQWKPSPGSMYPLLTWLLKNGYTEELPKEAGGIKRYVLTDEGAKFFEEHATFEDKLQKKVGPMMGPLFFLRMGLQSDNLKELQEPLKRLLDALFDLRVALHENLTEKTVAEVEEFLNDASLKIEELNKKIKRG